MRIYNAIFYMQKESVTMYMQAVFINIILKQRKEEDRGRNTCAVKQGLHYFKIFVETPN